MSRSVRLLLSLAIIVPVLGIAAVLVYVDATRDAPGGSTVLASADESAEPPQPLVAAAPADEPATQAPVAVDENPLRPVGPKASDRVTFYSSPSCSSGSCGATSQPCRPSCSSCG